jgi:hypothetical protein
VRRTEDGTFDLDERVVNVDAHDEGRWWLVRREGGAWSFGALLNGRRGGRWILGMGAVGSKRPSSGLLPPLLFDVGARSSASPCHRQFPPTVSRLLLSFSFLLTTLPKSSELTSRNTHYSQKHMIRIRRTCRQNPIPGTPAAPRSPCEFP